MLACTYLPPFVHCLRTDSRTMYSGFGFSQLEMSAYADYRRLALRILFLSVSEVVLAVLLSTFTFEHADKEIK